MENEKRGFASGKPKVSCLVGESRGHPESVLHSPSSSTTTPILSPFLPLIMHAPTSIVNPVDTPRAPMSPRDTANPDASGNEAIAEPVKVVKVKKSIVRKASNVIGRVNSIAESRIPLWVKLFVITVPSLVGLTGLSLYVLISGIIGVLASGKTDLAASVSSCLTSIIVEVQRERGLTVGVVESSGKYFFDSLRDQFPVTDASIEACLPSLRQLEHVTIYERYVESIKYLLTGLAEKRKYNLENYATLTLDDVMPHYTSIITDSMTLEAELARVASSQTSVLPRAVTLLRQRGDLLSLQQTVAARRGIFTSTFIHSHWTGTNSTFDPNAWTYYLTAKEWIATQDVLIKKYYDVYSAQDYQVLNNRVLDVLTKNITPLEQKALKEPYSNLTSISPVVYFDKCSEVIRTIDSLSLSLHSELMSENRSFYLNNLSQLIAGVLLIICFVIPVSLIVVWVCRITYKPVIQQRKDMQTAAEIADAIISLNFNGEKVQQLKRKPRSECQPLERGFQSILQSFESFMPYIPRHLLVRDETSKAAAGKDDDAASMVSANTSHSSKKSEHSGKRSQPISHGSGSSKNSSSIRRYRRNNARVSMRQVTVMVVDVNDFGNAASEMNFDALQAMYAELLTIVSSAVNKSNGVLQSFTGGILICSWNAAGSVFEPENKASDVALELVRNALNNPKITFRMRIGIASGGATVGELGNSEMRSFQVIGGPMTRAIYLSKLAKSYKSCILVDQRTFKAVNFSFDLRHVDQVAFIDSSLTSDGAESIFQLVRGKGVRQDEWMYTIADSAKKATFLHFNKAWRLTMQGRYTEAREKLNEFCDEMDKQDASDSVNLSGVAHLDKIITRGESDARYRYSCTCQNWIPNNNLSDAE